MKRERTVLATLLAAALAAPLTGCVTSSELVAADGSHRLIARDSQSGITVVLTTESWAGDSNYGDDLTVVHVLVANMGSDPVLLAPGDFELHDRRGFRYVLYDAGGAFAAMPADQAAGHQGEIPYDPGRSLAYESVRTQDGELGRLALPWGVLLPGTQMRGFIYFDDVRDSANHATLKWHAQTPEHRPLADFGFALHVARLR
ncbi:hypothetical protein G6O69_26610 [Pseudenhygromyxa sp. WMMC2535]|uniref:hypothetical protein n=1 Tax=Pseudenhygromyxa sp. WMMC2535 TaxID=2712867 RepID=UPI00155613AB|nr:hypothetical protein [Pseudenhygromyxa sp. WMMC2535]NVB41439.1 hypothetical protein [Pseudenhygromyxa sp. WMMC2535]